MVYMAPEVMTQAYDERSDVWSLGCMLLELTTTAIYDQKQLSEKLLEIKKDPYILEEVFEDIAKVGHSHVGGVGEGGHSERHPGVRSP